MDINSFLSPPLKGSHHRLLTTLPLHSSLTCTMGYNYVRLFFFFSGFCDLVPDSASPLALVSCRPFHLESRTPSPWLGCSIFHIVYVSQQISHRMGSSAYWTLSFHFLYVLALASLLGITDICLKAMSTTWRNSLILSTLDVFHSWI